MTKAPPSTATEVKLRRLLQQWRNCEPKAIADGSTAQIVYALTDAKHDVLALADALAAERARADKAERDRDEALQTARLANAAPDLNGEAIMLARQMLEENGVPVAAFFDDHVRNAIVQRNQERQRADALASTNADLVAQIAALREALEPFADFAEFMEAETEGFADTDLMRVTPEESEIVLADILVADFRRARAALAKVTP